MRLVVDALAALETPNLHVLIVDDNSPDGTGDVADQLAAQDPGRVHVLHRKVKDGLGRAYVAGMSWALAEDADIVIQMDADLSHPVAAIPRMITALGDDSVDVVIGSRYVSGGSTADDWPRSRRLLSRTANRYVNGVLRLHIRDATAGFKAWRASALKALDLDHVRSAGYAFQIETNYLARRDGLRVVEIPIHFAERSEGASKMSLAVQLEALAAPWQLRLRRHVARTDEAPGVINSRLLALIVFVVAAAARLSVIFRGSGLRGSFGYDAAVYFASGDALTHGRLPYRDFVFLHPPGLTVALSPFSLLARVTTDDAAFATACVAFALLGALNATLVMRLCRNLGLGRGPSVAGGLFYALWFGAVQSEYLTKLEPLGNTLLLCALLAAVRAQRDSSRRFSIVTGVMLGLLVSIKIWWAVPLLALAVWHVLQMRERRRAALHLLAGAAIAVAVLDLPFFLAAPRAMLTDVVKDQLGRPRTAGLVQRFADLTTVSRIAPRPSHALLTIAVVLAIALLAWVIRRAVRVRACRAAVLLLVAQLAVLIIAPSWFPYYTDYVAVAAAVVVAAACVGGRTPAAKRDIRAGWIPVVGVGLLTVLILSSARNAVRPFTGYAALTKAADPVRCVMSDAPMGLIELNALTRGLASGCRNWIDVTGPTYGRDRPTGPHSSRRLNLRWQRDLTGYLRSGQAVIIVRAGVTGVSTSTRRQISRDGVIKRAGNKTLYRVVR